MIAYSTDAPIYHPPLATIGLIIVNILLFFVVPPPVLNLVERLAKQDNHSEWDAADFAVDDEKAADVGGGAEAVPEPERRGEPLLLRLQFGQWNPLQWVTSPLLHQGIVQLLLNMIALWAFGLVVEGKVGSLPFLGLYFGIAILQAGLLQTLLIFSEGSFGGANAAVLGLLGIAVVWAPKNCFDVWFGFYFGVHEVPILLYGFIQFALAAIVFVLAGNGFANGAIQLVGLGMGLVAGFAWLKQGWVDCEGWDLLQVLKGDHGKSLHEIDEDVEHEAQQLIRSTRNANTPRNVRQLEAAQSAVPPPAAASATERRGKRSTVRRRKKKTAAADPTRAQAEVPLFDPMDDVERLIADGNYRAGLKLLRKLRETQPALELSQPTLAQVMRGLLADQDYEQAAAVMEEHIRRFANNRSTVQLHLARILLLQERPQKAISVLKSVDRSSLDETARQRWQQLAAHAKQQIDDGVIELSD